MPKVSIIIPTYNVGKYLRECMESVVRQTLSDIQIVCVNDGSTDDSLSILQEYAAKDSRIVLIDLFICFFMHTVSNIRSIKLAIRQ